MRLDDEVRNIFDGAGAPVLEDMIFLGYRGSIAHGTYAPSSDPNSIDDKDLMGVFVGPTEHYLGFGRQEIFEKWVGEWDTVSYELRKFVRLLLKSNPTLLSMLWLEEEHVLLETPAWTRLVENRRLFVSRQVYHSFVGYARSQIRKMTRLAKPKESVEAELGLVGVEIQFREGRTVNDPTFKHPDYETYSLNNLRAHRNALKGQTGYMGQKRKALVEEHGFDTKNAAHTIRLLRMGVEFLRDGELQVYREDAPDLLAIKRGERSIESIEAETAELFRVAEEEHDNSSLPERPDRESVEKLLVEMIRAHQER
ncbi:MAG: nucleotidyltransferase domain-containing protein [Rubrobacteraceae bacterium]